MRFGWKVRVLLGIVFLVLAVLTAYLEGLVPEDIDEIALVPGLFGVYFAVSGFLRYRVERVGGRP